MRRALLWLCAALSLAAQGTVQQNVQNVSPSALVNIYAVSLRWTGDPSTGAVALTPVGNSSQFQGWRIIAAEFSPGSPAPSANYSVALFDSIGVDLLSAGGGTLSATVPSSIIGSPSAPPIYGTFSLSITGQSVAGARGVVIVYLSPFTSIVSMGAATGGGGGGGAVTSVFGRTGAVVAAANDYNFNQLAGTLATAQVGVPQGNGTKVQLSTGTTTSGDAVKYDANGNAVDAGAAGILSGGAAGGDLNGTYPNPGVAQVNGAAVPTSAPIVGTNSSKQIVLATPHAVNAQTATYQVVAGDFTSYKTLTVASGTFTITLVASGSQPPTGQSIDVINYGTGVVTVAPSGQNINGAGSSLTIAAGSASAPNGLHVVSDGTNYFAQPWTSGGGSSVLVPSHRQSTSKRVAGTLASLSTLYSVASGDIILVAAGWEAGTGGTTISDNFGTPYTKVQEITSSTVRLSLFVGASAGAGALTITPTYPAAATFNSLHISVYDGGTVTTTVDASGIASTAGATTLSITTSFAGDLVWGAVEANSNTQIWYAPGGFALLESTQGSDSGASYMYVQPSAGLISCDAYIEASSVVPGGASNYALGAIALKHK